MVSNHALQRTFRMQFGASTATCFTIDVNSKQYLVTARHAIPTNEKSITIQLQKNNIWENLECELVGIPSDDIDIVVLAPPHCISESYPLEPTTEGLFLSQDVHFLGFPYGLYAEVGSLNYDFPLPLVKKACISMLKLQPEETKILYLDGINNPGFSGGPVVFSPHGNVHTMRVAAVISGYRQELNKVFIGEKETDLAVGYNTGIIIAYPIDYAIELINSDPIGANIDSQS
jgi:hypothetical protein